MCRLYFSSGRPSILGSFFNKATKSAHRMKRTWDGWGIWTPAAGTIRALGHGDAPPESNLPTIGHVRIMLPEYTRGGQIKNLHPIQYGSKLFVHNGRIEDYCSRRADLLAGILPEYRGRISVDAVDSEYLFFLFLSVGENIHDFVRFLESRKIQTKANFILYDAAAQTVSVFRGNIGTNVPPAPLYVARSRGGILVSTERLEREQTMIPAGKFMRVGAARRRASPQPARVPRRYTRRRSAPTSRRRVLY